MPKPYIPRDKAIVYAPVGFCIYCGARGREVELKKEHIVPLGLTGGFILPRSSCVACAKITGGVEQICLRTIFGPFRRHINLSSGRRKKQNTPLKLVVRTSTGKLEERMVPLSDYPKYLIVPKLLEPAIMRGEIRAPLIAEFECRYEKTSLAEIANKFGGTPLLSTDFDLLVFARMIAKIGYSFAVAEIGPENFEPLVQDLILGKDLSVAGGLVGQTYYTPKLDGLHPV